jgi:transposase
LAVLVYGYATGVFSSRKLERATYDSLAFRFIAANEQSGTSITIFFQVRRPHGTSVKRTLSRHSSAGQRIPA